ncbi:integrin alpha N-terminal domain containing protein [Babesia gibsoni]|uniref:Integrin alpha N-terminal domain containing protein n=1 Tax=Babesia gibsoni TaxID=33632 RepID=A0AAD8PDP0_BABGI|nr:integrin alpha N-terminal domain containing protein [Babesia gibsoni]
MAPIWNREVGLPRKLVVTALVTLAVVHAYELKVTPHKFAYKGHITDFGDYDSDGSMDALTYEVKGNKSNVYIFPLSSTLEERKPLTMIEVDGRVVGAIGADLNKDNALDVMVVLEESAGKYHLMAFYQNLETRELEKCWSSKEYVDPSSVEEKESVFRDDDNDGEYDHINKEGEDKDGDDNNGTDDEKDNDDGDKEGEKKDDNGDTDTDKNSDRDSTDENKSESIQEEHVSENQSSDKRVGRDGGYGFTSIYPLALDINGDGNVDFLCQTEDKKLFVWANNGGALYPFLIKDIPFCQFVGEIEGYIPSPHSSAFVDMDGDCRADLVLMLQHDDKRYLQIWQADTDGTKMTFTRDPKNDIELPPNHSQVSFLDINGDGTTDIAVPYCIVVNTSDGTCTSGNNVAITLNKQKPFCANIWKRHDSSECRKATELCTRSYFKLEPLWPVPPLNASLPSGFNFLGNKETPITVAFGDLNNNGFPDLMVLAKNAETSQAVVVVYRNAESKDLSSIHSRTFEEPLYIEIEGGENFVHRVSTVDLFEDGITEIAVFSSDNSSESNSVARFYKEVTLSTGLFMKTMVKGVLEAETQSSMKAFSAGYNVNGPTFKITVIDIYGTKSPRCSTIRAQSAHSPLLTPYAMFGLGRTNNYVEEFHLGMPSRSSNYSNMWISIIPNCSVMAIPFRLFFPNEWTVKLSLSPSKDIFKILITMLTCLVCLGMIIVGFDLKERREDSEQEKGFRQKFIIN